MRHPLHPAWLFLTAPLWTTVAPAQEVLFEETFDTDLSGWVATGNWGHASDQDPCLAGVLPLPSPGGAVRFGDPDCTFNAIIGSTWWPAGNLSTAVDQPIAIPADAQNPFLELWYFADSEGCVDTWDESFVYVSEPGGLWTKVAEACAVGEWVHLEVDLNAWRGQGVQLHFRFDAWDTAANSGLGWIVDDVRVVTRPCVSSNHCTASPNSAGPGAVMGYEGTKRIHRNDFVLTLDGGPPGEFAHFFYGPEPDQVPAADGFLCVGAGDTGLVRLLPSGSIDGSGHLQRAFDFPATLGSAAAVLPGTTWHFQCWYRDPSGGGTGSNFSDALQATFCP